MTNHEIAKKTAVDVIELCCSKKEWKNENAVTDAIKNALDMKEQNIIDHVYDYMMNLKVNEEFPLRNYAGNIFNIIRETNNINYDK